MEHVKLVPGAHPMQYYKDGAMTERSKKQNELEKKCLKTTMATSLIRNRLASLKIERPVLQERNHKLKFTSLRHHRIRPC